MSAPPADLKESQARRQTMVDCQIRTFDVTDQRLIARVLAVPRERFVPDEVRDLAYSDIGFEIDPGGSGDEARYLLPPLILVRLIQGARIKATDKVLDVACGGGYSTAILAGLADEVHALEASDRLVAQLRARLDSFGLDRLATHSGDLAAGVPDRGPFDVILINGAVESNLDSLLGQLSDGGRLVAPVRGPGDQTGRASKVICFEKRGADVGRRYLFDAFAPVLAAFKSPPAFIF